MRAVTINAHIHVEKNVLASPGMVYQLWRQHLVENSAFSRDNVAHQDLYVEDMRSWHLIQ
jgi:hypothetical protein